MNLQEIMKRLTYYDGNFPRKALERAIKEKEAIIPELLKVIEHSTKNITCLVNKKDYFAHIYSIYLLAQFREKRAFKRLASFFSIPGEMPIEAVGDAVVDELFRIFASIFDGDTIPIKHLVENEKISDYVRSSGIQTFTTLFNVGEMRRDEVFTYFKELYDGKLERKFSLVWNMLVNDSISLYPEELYEEVKKAIEDDLVEPQVATVNFLNEIMEKGKKKVLSELKEDRFYRRIDNTIEELENWHCFQ